MIATNARYFRVHRHDLVYLKFIIEAYEGLATMSTVNRDGVIIRVAYPSFFSRDVADLLQALGKEIEMTEVPPPVECSGSLPVLSGEKEACHA